MCCLDFYFIFSFFILIHTQSTIIANHTNAPDYSRTLIFAKEPNENLRIKHIVVSYPGHLFFL